MSQLLVALNGIEVGILEKARSGAMTFQYLKEWVNRPGARAISLSLPLTLAPYKGEKVYNFFDNLLPDSDTLRARIQARFRVASNFLWGRRPPATSSNYRLVFSNTATLICAKAARTNGSAFRFSKPSACQPPMQTWRVSGTKAS